MICPYNISHITAFSIEYPCYQEYNSLQNFDNQPEPELETVPIVSYQTSKPKFNLVQMQKMPRLSGLETVFLPAHDKYHSSHHKTKPKPSNSRNIDPKDTYLCRVSFPKSFPLTIT